MLLPGELSNGLWCGFELRKFRGFLASSFIGVEGFITAPQQLFGRFTGLVIGPAAREPAGYAGGLVFDLKPIEAIEDVFHFVRAAFRQEDHKFIATETHREIGAANGLAQTIGETLEHQVTGRVAELVVNLF